MILDDFKLDGLTALVTGSSRGIGRAMALALAEAGANVVLAARSKEHLEAVAVEIEALGVAALPVPVDMANDDDLERLVQATIERFGRIDILVNNAGTTHRTAAEDYSTDQWDRVMNVNLRGVFVLTTKVAKAMIAAGGGRIVNTTSLAAEIGIPFIPPYCASKGGLRQLTKAWAIEWAKYNIRVNAIGPGYILTDLTQALRDDPARNEIVMNRVAIKRWGEPADLKGAVVFLASKASSYMTGQTLYVDGGWLAG